MTDRHEVEIIIFTYYPAPAQGVKLRGGKVLKNHENSQISMFKVIKVGDIT